MMYGVVLGILACVFVGTNALIDQTCNVESECDAGECCQILSEFMVVSKRLMESQIALSPEKTGTCQRYKTEGEYCDNFAKVNGYCSCGPGLQCNTYEVPVSTDAPFVPSRRDMMPSRPGYTWVSKCEKI